MRGKSSVGGEGGDACILHKFVSYIHCELIVDICDIVY